MYYANVKDAKVYTLSDSDVMYLQAVMASFIGGTSYAIKMILTMILIPSNAKCLLVVKDSSHPTVRSVS